MLSVLCWTVAAITPAKRHTEDVLHRGLSASYFWKTADRRVEGMADQASSGLAHDSQTCARFEKHVSAVGATKGPDILGKGSCEVRGRNTAKHQGHVMRKHDTSAVERSTAVSVTLGYAKY